MLSTSLSSSISQGLSWDVLSSDVSDVSLSVGNRSIRRRHRYRYRYRHVYGSYTQTHVSICRKLIRHIHNNEYTHALPRVWIKLVTCTHSLTTYSLHCSLTHLLLELDQNGPACTPMDFSGILCARESDCECREWGE